MHLVPDTPPASLAELILQSVCDHLRRHADLGASPEIAPPDLRYIKECTEAAVQRLDGPEGRLGRCLLTQRWSLFLDCFPPVIELPLPPLQAVTCLKYIGSDGTWQTLPTIAYRVSGAGSWQAEVAPADGHSWPATQNVRDSVEVRFRAGYGDATTDVPADILQAIRILAAHYYTERQAVSFMTPHEIPLSARDLIQSYRIYR